MRGGIVVTLPVFKLEPAPFAQLGSFSNRVDAIRTSFSPPVGRSTRALAGPRRLHDLLRPSAEEATPERTNV
jgi:hypothetical protein